MYDLVNPDRKRKYHQYLQTALKSRRELAFPNFEDTFNQANKTKL